MAKTLPAAVITQIDAQQKRPCILIEMGLSSTLRFAAEKTNIVFPTAGNTYYAKAIKIPSISQSLEGQINRISIEFDNILMDMAGYIDNEDFYKKSIIIKRVFLDDLSDATYYVELFNGWMDTPVDINREWVKIDCYSGKPLSYRTVTKKYNTTCRHRFGNAQCNYDGNADLTSLTASGTCDSGTTTTFVDSGLTQADDYWKYGMIKLTKSSIDYYRICKSFTASSDTVELDIPVPFSIDNTVTFQIWKGCDKTFDTCQANNEWGPSADNKDNYGGFIHISSALNSDVNKYVFRTDGAGTVWDFGRYFHG